MTPSAGTPLLPRDQSLKKGASVSNTHKLYEGPWQGAGVCMFLWLISSALRNQIQLHEVLHEVCKLSEW